TCTTGSRPRKARYSLRSSNQIISRLRRSLAPCVRRTLLRSRSRRQGFCVRTPARRAAKPPSDARLTRERIVEVALELLATHGAGLLSMRCLADALGPAPMSLYRHVHRKDGLLSAIVATVPGGLDFDLPPRAACTDRV